MTATGSLQPVEIVPYDFLRPPRISKDRRVVLESIFHHFAVALQALLSSRLRTPMDVACSMEQASFGDFASSLRSPCAAFVLDLGGASGGQAVVDFDSDLAFFCIDRIFGGPGDRVSLERALTALERTVLRGLAERVAGLLQEAWKDHLTLALQVTGFESVPDLIRIANAADSVLVAKTEVRSAAVSGVVALAIPLHALETFLSEKGTPGRAVGGPAAGSSAGQRRALEAALRGAKVEVVARFPALRLTAREIAGLRAGQVIATRQPVDAPLDLLVSGQHRFHGVVGGVQGALGVRITHLVDRSRSSGERPIRGRVQ